MVFQIEFYFQIQDKSNTIFHKISTNNAESNLHSLDDAYIPYFN